MSATLKWWSGQRVLGNLEILRMDVLQEESRYFQATLSVHSTGGGGRSVNHFSTPLELVLKRP